MLFVGGTNSSRRLWVFLEPVLSKRFFVGVTTCGKGLAFRRGCKKKLGLFLKKKNLQTLEPLPVPRGV